MRAEVFSEICAERDGNLERLARQLAVHCAGDSGADALPALASWLAADDASPPPVTAATEPDGEYADNLLQLRDGIDWVTGRVRAERARRRLQSGARHDLLVGLAPVVDWSPLILLTHAALLQIRPMRQAAVVVSMRDEGISILEWIAHYRAIGFSAIFVYTNDNVDGSDRLLGLLADHGIITLIDNVTTGRAFPQGKAYAHSLHFLPELRDYEWVFYVDADEFLVVDEAFDWSVANVLASVTSRYRDRLPAAICYHWRWYVSGFAFARTEGLLLERFQHALPQPNFKSVVHLAEVLSMRQLHMPEVVSGGHFIDSALEVIPGSTGTEPCRHGVWAYDGNGYRGGQLNHYWCKSFEEFLVKRHRSANSPDPSHRRGLELFFGWNAAAKPEDRVPPPPRLLDRVRAELRRLRALEGVAAAEAGIEEGFRALVGGLAGPDGAARLYRELAQRLGVTPGAGGR